MVLTTKKLVTEKGILLSSTVIPGKVLLPATAEMVKQFFISDKISRLLPGTKKKKKIMVLLTDKVRWFTFRNN
jgi:hypothetical protein